MQSEEIQKAAARVLAVLKRTDAHGRPVHDAATIQHFVPWMAVHMKVDFASLPEPVQRLVGRFIEMLALPAGASYDDLLAATDRFYAEYPLDADLKRDVEHAIRNGVAEIASAGAIEGMRRQTEGSSGSHVFRRALSSESSNPDPMHLSSSAW